MKTYKTTAESKAKKSAWYREDLKHHIGKMVTLECSFYTMKPYNNGMVRVCLQEPLIVGSEAKTIEKHGLPTVDHMWVLISRAVKIDPFKPLRMTGIPYEYVHKCGEKFVKNVSVSVKKISQSTVTSVI